MSFLSLNDPVQKLPYVGPTYATRLTKLGIVTIDDLINHFPFRYDDFSLISSISRLQAGETATIKAKILAIKNEYTKNGKKIQKATVADSSGEMEIIWFNQPYLVRAFKIGEEYQFSGKADWFGRNIVFISPEHEKLSANSYLPAGKAGQLTAGIHTGRLVPVYPETAGISSKWLRTRIKSALQVCGEQIEEFLPVPILLKEGLMPEKQAIFKIHFPENKVAAEKAKQRLAFDELFLIQLAGLWRKRDWQKKLVTYPLKIDQVKISDFVEKLPFTLTGAQNKVTKEILLDLTKDQPMNRLLQGDVGSGKTVVAAIAMYATFLNGLSSIFMAPTEILAIQHYQTLSTLLAPLGIRTELITSSHKCQLSANSCQLTAIVGTHALLYQDLPKNIGLVIIDEQHRFGVEQRDQLVKISAQAKTPHLLTMTATPIPRTVALTLFGDLDLSFLDEMPKGRIKIRTWVVPQQKRPAAYDWIRKRVEGTKEQAFIICPLIEESETLATVKAVTSEFAFLAKTIFPELKLGLLHGRMKAKEKEEIIKAFRQGELDILVATPVVEVGLDIPNATIMMIEGAERFGLAQLHQLRGRVGRSNLESFCLLFTENPGQEVIKRLKFMETKNIGRELAEIDLARRGPGEIYGLRQHGFPDLKIASFSDLGLIERTRQSAEALITNNFSLLTNPNSPLNKKLQKYKIREVISN